MFARLRHWEVPSKKLECSPHSRSDTLPPDPPLSTDEGRPAKLAEIRSARFMVVEQREGMLGSGSQFNDQPVLCKPAAIPLMVAPRGYSKSELRSPCCLR